jgi:glutathione S-transferase
MKLFYSPGACSMASHIILHEVGQPFDIEKVDMGAKTTQDGSDYLAINPKGMVPVLQVGGETLTEGPAILQYIADSAEAHDLSPKPGTLSRARVTELLNFTGTELHIAFKPLFNPNLDEAGQATAKANVGRKFDWLEARLMDGRDYLTGPSFTVADAYAFVVSNWANFKGIAVSDWPNLSAFLARVAARPSAQAAMKAEGLIG